MADEVIGNQKVWATDPNGKRWWWLADDDRDGCEHYAVSEDGSEKKHLDWSRFKSYWAKHFVWYVASGFPDQTSHGVRGNWFPEDMEAWGA